MDGTLGSAGIGRLSVLHRFVSLGISARRHRLDGAWNASHNARHFSGRTGTQVTAACVLVVDDDAGVRHMLVEYLGAHDYEVAAVANGTEMRAALARRVPDVVLLDVGLPGEDGLSLARYLRERYPVGIIMVTAADGVVDRVVGLEMGADDYVAKPFDPRELRARLKSVLRRLRDDGGSAAPAGARVRPRIGRCTLDVDARRLLDADGRDVGITAMEFDLLKAFVEHPNQVLSRDRLLTLTRNREWEPFDRSIDIRIARLRRKVEVDPDHPLAIQTVRGAGYMFVPPAG
jgi:two-component system, OmpR family, response regulator